MLLLTSWEAKTVLLCGLLFSLLMPVSIWSSLFAFICEVNASEFFKSTTIYHLMTSLQLHLQCSFDSGVSQHSDSRVPVPVDFTYKKFIHEVVRIHRRPQLGTSLPYLIRPPRHVLQVERTEALQSMRAAVNHQIAGRALKAKKLLEHASQLDPDNTDILVALGEALESSWRLLHYNSEPQKTSSSETDSKFSTVTQAPEHGPYQPPENPTIAVVLPKPHALSSFPLTRLHYSEDELLVIAEHMYTKALVRDPNLQKATYHHRRIRPLVEEIDQRRFNTIDQKVQQFYRIPDNDPGLRKTKLEHYFRHVYHSNAIEGNTLSLAQTRSILETRLAIGGKSLLEQNEVLGLDAALRFMNTSLLRGISATLTLSDILMLHRHLLGFVDLTEAGRFRRTQVFIADHTPPPAESLPLLMAELVAWLNSDQVADLHPIELAALLHWKFVYIHPFYDGNGRTARLLMNLILMRAGLPPAIIRLEDRLTYYDQLKTANEGDVRPFIRFITACTERTLDEYLASASTNYLEPKDVVMTSDELSTVETHRLFGKSVENFPKFIALTPTDEDNNTCNQSNLTETQNKLSYRHHHQPTQMAVLPNVLYVGG